MSCVTQSSATCIFCKIIVGSIPCHKLYETSKCLAFLDVNPLSRGHTLIIPKFHAATLLDVPTPFLTEILPIAKQVASHLLPFVSASDFNLLQNNGVLAHQQVMHVHFHLIPKFPSSQGLNLSLWSPYSTTQNNPNLVDDLTLIQKSVAANLPENIEI